MRSSIRPFNPANCCLVSELVSDGEDGFLEPVGDIAAQSGRVVSLLSDDALHTYASALEVYPGHIPALEALTRLQLRHARPDEHTLEHLQTLAMDGDSPQWREWAQRQLSKRP